MENNEKDAACGADALKEVRAAEHDLAEAGELEKRAEAHLEKAAEELEHDKPHEVQIIVNGRKSLDRICRCRPDRTPASLSRTTKDLTITRMAR